MVSPSSRTVEARMVLAHTSLAHTVAHRALAPTKATVQDSARVVATEMPATRLTRGLRSDL